MAERIERDPRPLGRLLDMLVANRGWGERMALGRLRASWASVVGEQVAARSEPFRFERGVLTVLAEGGAWATELTLLAAGLAASVNASLGEQLVREVRVVAGRPGAPE